MLKGGNRSATSLATLRKLNIGAFVVHAALAVALLSVFASQWDSARFGFPVYHTTLEDSSDNVQRGAFKHTPRLDEWFRVYVPVLVILFPAITAGFHLGYWLDPLGWYEQGVRKGSQRMRWIEYAITATLMIVAVLIMSGVNTGPALLLGIALNIALMMQGTNVEEEISRFGRRTYVSITSTSVGWLAATALTVVIATSFAKSIDDAKKLGDDIPSWVYFVIVPSILFYLSFGAVQFAQMIQPKSMYAKYEWYYIILSFVSKAFLAIWVAIGLLRQTSDDETEATTVPA